MKKIVFLYIFLLITTYAYCKDIKIDTEYIKEHYPEVYNEILQKGKQEAMKEIAEKGKADSNEQVENETEKKEMSPNILEWWRHSSLSEKYKSNKFQKHFEVSYSYANIDGNTEGFLSKGRGDAFLRWSRFTNITTAIISRRKISQGGGQHNNVDYKLFENFLKYDLNKTFYVEGGGIWEKDSPNAVDSRLTLLAGLGAYLVDTDRFNLDVLVGAGWQKEKYAPIIDYYFDFSSRDSYIYYFYETFNWFITDKLALRHGFRSIVTSKKYNYYSEDKYGNLYIKKKDNKELYKLHFALEYMFNRYFSLMFSENVNYDTLPWPEVKKRDEVRTLSIKFRY